ncbi:MAG: hypothetical protein KF784_01340 [Fimbriimonadaceae bacterium]|nr:hypothetical protein [Fimbriimonadaceae bacterium]
MADYPHQPCSRALWENWVEENVDLILKANLPLVAVSSLDEWSEFCKGLTGQTTPCEMVKSWNTSKDQIAAVRQLMERTPEGWF